MYKKLNIYIKQMTSSECPLGRPFIEVALRVSGEGSFDSGKQSSNDETLTGLTARKVVSNSKQSAFSIYSNFSMEEMLQGNI